MATEVMALTSDAKVWQPPASGDDDRRFMSGEPAQFQATLRLGPSNGRLTIPSASLARRPQLVEVIPEKREVLDAWKARVPPQGEVCMECAMRDAEMIDVDVTSPGVWDRESDVWYEELVRKERDDEKIGRPPSTSGPRAKGLNLTESNLRLWLSMNPKEAHAREHNVRSYVKAQCALLEEENIARSQAVRESRELTEQMKHTYSSLRRSAYELSSSLTSDEGIRIRQPSPIRTSFVENPETSISPKKEAVLLENGMIMEKLDLKKEEQARRKRAARSRQRTDSRTSARELLPSAASVRSMGSVTRPISVATSSAPNRTSQVLPSTYSRRSQSSNEAAPSMDRGSKSPRFFNFRNWSDAASRSSVALSGSMMDMHIGLEQDQNNDIPPLPPLRPTLDLPPIQSTGHGSVSPGEAASSLKKVPSRGSTVVSKRKSKLGKFLRLLGGSKADSSEKSTLRTTSDLNSEDQSLPLDPPPPLSLLVDRARSPSLSYSHTRHAQSTLSLSSASARNPNFSSFTTASSALTTPTSPKFRDPVGEFGKEGLRLNGDPRVLHRNASESDIKHAPSTVTLPSRQSRSFPQSAPARQSNPSLMRPVSTNLDKALPPIPGIGQERPHTVMFPPRAESPLPTRTFPLYDARSEKGIPRSELEPPRLPNEARRQSLGGLTSRPALPKSPMRQTEPQMRRYSEFGLSRRSLNRYDDDAMHYYEKPSQILESKSPNGGDYGAQPTPSKRRSRFGLSSLFGRKSHDKEMSAPEMGLLSYSSATLLSQDRSLGNGRHLRNPSACRSTGALVDQERNFIAYRYPSVNEQLDLPL